jgi:hypothetical protein
MWLLFYGFMALFAQYAFVISALLVDFPTTDSVAVRTIASRLKMLSGLQYSFLLIGSLLVVLGALSQRPFRDTTT